MANLQWQVIQSNYEPIQQVAPIKVQGLGNIGNSVQSVSRQVLDRANQQNPQEQIQNPETISQPSVNPTSENLPQAEPSDEFIQKALHYGQKYNIDPAVYLAKGHIESSFNPNAGADRKMRYGGLFGLDTKQFGDKVYSADFAFDEVSRQYLNNKKVWESKGIENPTLGDMYLMHQQGQAGALALRNGGEKLAGEVLNPYYKNHRKYSSLGIEGGFQPVFQNIAIRDPNQRAEIAKSMTASEFYDYWVNKGNQAYDYWKNHSRLVKFKGN